MYTSGHTCPLPHAPDQDWRWPTHTLFLLYIAIVYIVVSYTCMDMQHVNTPIANQEIRSIHSTTVFKKHTCRTMARGTAVLMCLSINIMTLCMTLYNSLTNLHDILFIISCNCVHVCPAAPPMQVDQQIRLIRWGFSPEIYLSSLCSS